MAQYGQVGFQDLWGKPQLIDISLYSSTQPLPEAYRNLGKVGCQVNLSSGGPYYVVGTENEVRAAISAAQTTQDDNEEVYNPTVTSSGAGVVTAVGGWRAIRMAGRVFLSGRLSFTPAVPATGETIRVTLPTSMQPAANFAATTDAGGVCMGDAAITATDSIGQPRAQVGAKLIEMVLDQSQAGAAIYGVCATYSQ